MYLHHASKLVTSKYGLAPIRRLFASPYHFHGNRIAIASRKCPCPTPSRLTEHPQPRDHFPSWRWRRGRHPTHPLRLARMAPSRSHSHQQPLAQQNGQRHPQTTRQRRSVHNASSPHRSCHCSDRLLAVRQLLVAGPRRPRYHCGLTNAPQAPTQPYHAYQRCKRNAVAALFLFVNIVDDFHSFFVATFWNRGGRIRWWDETGESGERLAACGAFRGYCY